MKHIKETNLKLESEEQLKNCEDMHIWVQPIKEYIKKLEAKDELLGLYKEKISILENSKYLNRFSRSFDIDEVNKLLEVITKISKLEEELK